MNPVGDCMSSLTFETDNEDYISQPDDYEENNSNSNNSNNSNNNIKCMEMISNEYDVSKIDQLRDKIKQLYVTSSSDYGIMVQDFQLRIDSELKICISLLEEGIHMLSEIKNDKELIIQHVTAIHHLVKNLSTIMVGKQS